MLALRSLLPRLVTQTTATSAEPPRVVILGGGFAGLNAAKRLAHAPVRVTLIDRHNYHLFQPLLYQVATASLSPADVAGPLRAILRRQTNASVLLANVRSVDLERKVVLLDDGEIDYDYLVVAIGSETAYFGRADWVPLAPGLKTIDDAVEIRRRIFLAFERAERATTEERRRAALTFVVVGGGPTGVELAGALGEIAHETLVRDFRSIDPRSARIVLLDGGDRILPTFAPKMSTSAQKQLERLGVEVITHARVTEITERSVGYGDQKIEADTILWAAGVRATSIGEDWGVERERDGRIKVPATLNLAAHPEVFIAGDLASIPEGKGGSLPGVAQVAIQSGKAAAENIARAVAGQSAKPFHYRDYGIMATIGRNRAVAEIAGLKFGGFPAWFIWAVIHIRSLIDFRSRVLVFFEWGWAYLTHRRSARLITRDEVTLKQ